ncbi:MAG TPA: hypothetical protein VGH16_22925 [Candidatus Binatia bacterium]|jgi:hypothetical protein
MSSVQKRNMFSAQQEFTPAARNPAVEEKVFSLFQPDILIPGQFLATTKSKTHRDPEQRLMLAVLEDAVWCFQNGLRAKDKKKQDLSREAEEWLMEEESQWLFSFNEICDLLGLEARYIRKRLVLWKTESLSARGKHAQRTAHPQRKTNGRTKSQRYLRAVAGF